MPIRRRLPILVMAALATSSVTGQAPASPTPDALTVSESGWIGGAYAVPGQPRSFSHCGITLAAPDGDSLIFAMDAGSTLTLAVVAAGRALPAGTTLLAEVRIDDRASVTLPAIAAAGGLILLPTGGDTPLLGNLREGRVLQVTMGDMALSFPLDGTYRALAALDACVVAAKTFEGPLPQAMLPSADAAPQAGQMVPPADGMSRLALERLLSAAGIEGVRFPAAADVDADGLGLSHVWQVGPVVGGLRQETRSREPDLDDFAGRFIDNLRGRCPGDSVVETGETQPATDSYAVKPARLQCTVGGVTSFVALVFALDGDHYSVFFHEGPQEASDIARDMTARIEALIRELIATAG